MIYFSDVDVVGKLAACGFLPLLPELLELRPDQYEIRYLPSLRARLTRASKRLKHKEHQGHLEHFCSAHRTIEGSADLEREQALIQAGLDVGEALLFAEAETTGGVVVTGDKRALLAYAKASTAAQRSRLKVVCWEQLLLRVHALRGFEMLKAGCCAAMESDKLLSLAFSNGLATEEGHALEALRSYLRGVEAHSSDILLTLQISS